jgi:hypothetical protein
MRQVYTGEYDKEALDKLGEDAGDPETQIQALLTPDQTAAYPNYNRKRTPTRRAWRPTSGCSHCRTPLT